MTEARYEGGCLCGAVRYEATGPVRQAGWCHCRLCQRSVGAPAVPWGSFFLENFRWTKGKPALHHSTPKAERSFCAECGTSLTFRYLTTEPPEMDVALASLDDPEVLHPQWHIWTMSSPSWVHFGDGLKTYQDNGPERSTDPDLPSPLGPQR